MFFSHALFYFNKSHSIDLKKNKKKIEVVVEFLFASQGQHRGNIVAKKEKTPREV